MTRMQGCLAASLLLHLTLFPQVYGELFGGRAPQPHGPRPHVTVRYSPKTVERSRELVKSLPKPVPRPVAALRPLPAPVLAPQLAPRPPVAAPKPPPVPVNPPPQVVNQAPPPPPRGDAPHLVAVPASAGSGGRTVASGQAGVGQVGALGSPSGVPGGTGSMAQPPLPAPVVAPAPVLAPVSAPPPVVRPSPVAVPPVAPPAPVQPPPATPKPAPSPSPAPAQPAPPDGPTCDAVPVSQPLPEIPTDMRQQGIKLKVSVTFTIHVDGSCAAEMQSNTGNADLDARTLQALQQWRWKPAQQRGVPYESVQTIKVRFVVE